MILLLLLPWIAAALFLVGWLLLKLVGSTTTIPADAVKGWAGIAAVAMLCIAVPPIGFFIVSWYLIWDANQKGSNSTATTRPPHGYRRTASDRRSSR